MAIFFIIEEIVEEQVPVAFRLCYNPVSCI